MRRDQRLLMHNVSKEAMSIPAGAKPELIEAVFHNTST